MPPADALRTSFVAFACFRAQATTALRLASRHWRPEGLTPLKTLTVNPFCLKLIYSALRACLEIFVENKSRTFYIVTLGCKVNQYESQALREAWARAGFQECDAPKDAGQVVIHSCAVTANAVADTRAMVRRMHKAAPEAAIWLMGCAAEACGPKLAELPGVAGVIARKNKTAFILSGPRNPEEETRAAEKTPLIFPPLAISSYPRARPVIKVQDGCSHGCTYCIVPLTRGRSVSRPPEDILAEMRRLHEAGFQELILSGINLRQYGRDFAKSAPIRDFWDLLAFLEKNLAPEWSGRARWRLSSLEPGQLNEAALEVLSESRLVAPHLHISLQSGSPGVLKRMGRGHYRPENLPDFLEKLHSFWPRMGLGADLLMAFPGESEAEFEETRAFVEALPLTYAHVFPFSARPGTSAADLPGRIPHDVAEKRAAIIRELAAAKKEAFLRALLNRDDSRLRMVLESRESGLGVSEYYASCRLPREELASGVAAGELLTVRPLAVEDGLLLVTRKS